VRRFLDRSPRGATKVLVTGASGFIGAAVVRRLLGHGFRVTAVVRPGSSLRRLEDVADRVGFVERDLEDAGACRGLVAETAPDVVLHLAWYLQPGDWSDSPRNLDCLAGSLALLDGVAGTACRRVVVAGSSVEYDTDLGFVTESSPVRPRTLYGACKASLFLAGERLARRHGWGFAQARIFNVYGPGEDPRRFVPHVVNGLLRGEPCDLTPGDQVRDYLHVVDVASALVALAVSEVEGAVNVASSRPVTIATLAQTIARLLGRPDLLRLGARPPRPGDYACLYADNRLLRDRAGWRPRYGLEAGLRQTIGWWAHSGHDPLRGPTRARPRGVNPGEIA
jgi:nucleoside-diphosphate-sugar epimerase